MSFASPSLKGRALRLLGQREHSRTELGVPLLPVDEPPAPAAKPGKAEKAAKAKDVDTAPVAE